MDLACACLPFWYHIYVNEISYDILLLFCQCLVKNQSSLLNNSRAQSHGDSWSFHDIDTMYLFKKVKQSFHCKVILLLLLWHSILMNLKLEIKEIFYISNALIKNYLFSSSKGTTIYHKSNFSVCVTKENIGCMLWFYIAIYKSNNIKLIT